MEQRPVYDAIDFRKDNVYTQTYSNGKFIRETIIDPYVCPSDTNSELFQPPGTAELRAVANYAFSGGAKAINQNPSYACAEWTTWNAYKFGAHDEIFRSVFNRHWCTKKLTDCIDGTSSTIMVGEVRRDCSRHVMQGWLWSNDAQGMISTVVPINYDSCKFDDPNPCRDPRNWATEFGYKSLHPQGMQAAMLDASVHFIPQTIDHTAFQLLGCPNDQQVAKVP